MEQLFVGNKLARNQAQLAPGMHVDLKAVKAPVVVFASHGDNITPPQQALNWITDSYADAEEIAIRGQRIIYIEHEQVGHLGIFVSSSVARKEHTKMESVMGTIESLAPGLYEMVIEDMVGQGADARFTVSFAKRNLDDLRALDDIRTEEKGLAAVSRLSEIQAETYALGLRPMVRAMVTPQAAAAGRPAPSACSARIGLVHEPGHGRCKGLGTDAARSGTCGCDQPLCPG